MLKIMPMKSWLILLLIVFVLLALLGWRSGCDEAKEAKDQGTIADARTGAAGDAAKIDEKNDARNDAQREEVSDAQDAIRAEADPAVRDRTARYRLCKLQRPDGPC